MTTTKNDGMPETITYTCGPECKTLAGKTLTGGKPDGKHPVYGMVVRFDAPADRNAKFGDPDTVLVKVAGKPDLAKLVEQYQTAKVAQQQAEQQRQADQDAAFAGRT